MQKEQIRTRLISSTSYDPWFNLALEECLLDQVGENEIILYLWQNDNTVVIGRNQNPWKECKCNILEASGGKLARRLSGGGAVYHDLGNLNFTFIMDKKLYDLPKQLKVILDAVNNMGVKAEFTGRNDITVDGRKISGNAFYYRDTTAYHHGTVLINCDMNKLVDFLQVSMEKIVSKGVESVRSRVVNLKEIKPEINVEETKKAITKAFLDIYGGNGEEILVEEETVKKYYERYASWEWRYGNTPKFDLTLSHRFSWGGIDLGLSFKNGQITQSKIYSDSLSPDLIEKVANSLNGLPLNMGVITETLASVETMNEQEEEIKKDLSKWIGEQSL